MQNKAEIVAVSADPHAAAIAQFISRDYSVPGQHKFMFEDGSSIIFKLEFFVVATEQTIPLRSITV